MGVVVLVRSISTILEGPRMMSIPLPPVNQLTIGVKFHLKSVE